MDDMNETTIKISKALLPIAEAVDETLIKLAGERMGFMLVVFTQGRASYISNAPRPEAIAEMRKLLKHWESGNPDIPAHEYN